MILRDQKLETRASGGGFLVMPFLGEACLGLGGLLRVVAHGDFVAGFTIAGRVRIGKLASSWMES